jgi:hypothetical protein
VRLTHPLERSASGVGRPLRPHASIPRRRRCRCSPPPHRAGMDLRSDDPALHPMPTRQRRGYFYSPDRRGEHREVHQASRPGLNAVRHLCGLRPAVRGRPSAQADRWVHARRKCFDLVWLNEAPIAIEAVARVDAPFAVEREACPLLGFP